MKTTTHPSARTVTILSALATILVVAAAVFAWGRTTSAQVAPQAGTGSTTLMIMKHLCPSSIRSTQELSALQAQAGDAIGAFLKAETTCPVIRNSGHSAPSGAIGGPPTAFQFELIDKNGTVHPWSEASFMASQACENQVNRDVNGDGQVLTSTCFDTSHYAFTLPEGAVTLIETMPPSGAMLGTVLFTPTQIVANNDANSLKKTYAANGVVTLNTAGDTDRGVMLHVYNFLSAGSTGSGSSSSPGSGVATCNGMTATVSVDGNGMIVGGSMNGQRYTGTLNGTGGPDVIVGTSGHDNITAFEGNDVICGMGGNDHLQGSQDNDWISGGDGNDHLGGGHGMDALYGGPDNDNLWGDSENDMLFGEAGNDQEDGGDGDDQIDGGAGNDTLRGHNGFDICTTGENLHNCESGTASSSSVSSSSSSSVSSSSSSSVSSSSSSSSSSSAPSSSSSSSSSSSLSSSSSSSSSVSSSSSSSSSSVRVNFSATLNGAKEVPAVSTSGQGTGTFTLSGSSLSYSLSVSTLSSAITAAHFHRGPAGQTGAVIQPITFSGNAATGVWNGLSAQDLTDLLAGRIYVNVHTTTYPNGEIRGQVE